MSGKRSDLSVLEKRDILKQYDDLKKCSQRKAASILGISQPLLCKMLKDRHKIEYHEEFNLPITRKRKRAGKCVKVEDGLLRWFVQARTSCVHVTNAILLNKALSIAAQLGIQDFNPTDGWLSRWKSRNNVVFKKPTEDKKYVDIINNENWLDHYLRDVLPYYNADNVYNMGETGLYFRALPCLNTDGKNLNANECNYQKHRLTVLFVCNMTGTDKKRPLVIGRSQNPRCFHNVKKLPVDYCANSNAWMTSIIFTDFLKQWDKKLEKRKILLLLNNCTAHPNITLNNITLMFLPVNTTSIVQPLDVGIINTVKTNYRKLMHSYIVNNVRTGNISPLQISCKITILEAAHMLAESWEKVTPDVIQKCFYKAGFSLQCANVLNVDIVQEPEDLNLQNWVNMDDSIPTSGPFSDSDIIKSYFTQENTKLEMNNDENENSDKDVPTSEEIRAAIETIKKSLQRFGNEDTFKLFYKLKSNIENHLQDSCAKTNMLSLLE